MMPFHNPTPETKRRAKDSPAGGGLMSAWIQAEKLIQIALVLPCAALIGWLLGAWLDHMLHQKWIATAGIIFGIFSGLVGAIQMAVVYSREPRQKGPNGDSAEKGNSDKTS